MKRVAICIPSGDMVHADFAMSLAALCYRSAPFVHEGKSYEAIPLAIVNTKGSLVVNNRNKLVEEARALGVDYLFFVDSDMTMPPFTLRRLLELDKDIVGATYITRDEPMRLLGSALNGKPLAEAMGGIDIDPNNPLEVGALPGGCLLVKLSVFDGMVKPYFQTPAHEATETDPAWIEGEDYFFCRQARAAGFSIWLDWHTSFHIGHVGQRVNKIPFTENAQEETGNALIVH